MIKDQNVPSEPGNSTYIPGDGSTSEALLQQENIIVDKIVAKNTSGIKNLKRNHHGRTNPRAQPGMRFDDERDYEGGDVATEMGD